MRSFLQHISTQDDATRKRWFIILTASGGVVVVALWLIVVSFVDIGPVAAQKPPIEIAENQASSFSSLKNAIADVWGKTKESLSSAVIEFEKTVPSPSSTEATTSTPATN